jgi:penicillin amidase
VNHLLRLPALSALDIPVQGGPGTLSPSAGAGTMGPSWRMVVELGPELRAWATYPGGQSGNPVSPRYRDRLALWTAGQLEPVRFPRTADALDAAHRVATLTLQPSP